MSTEYGQRLRQAMARAGIKAQQLGDAIGTSRGAIYQALDGSTLALSARNNALAADFLDVDPVWLATGEGTMSAVERPAVSSAPFVVAGSELPEEIAELALQGIPAVHCYSGDRHAFVVQTPDDSMSPRYLRGEGAIVEPSAPMQIEDDVLLVMPDGSWRLHRLLGTTGGTTLGDWRGSTGLVTLQRDEYRAIYVIVGRIGFRRLLSK